MKANIFGMVAILLLPAAGALAQGQTVADVVKQAHDKEHDGDWKGAVEIYSEILQQFPKEFPEIYAERAGDLSLAHDYKDALADYTKALALDNDPKNQILNHDVILSERAQVKNDLGDVKGAIADYHASLKIKPGNSFVIADLAEVELDVEDCSGANTDYSQAIALATVPETLYFENRGIARLCLGDIANSYSDYQAAVAQEMKDDPGNFSDLFLNAWAVGVHLGRAQDANKALAEELAGVKDNGSLEEVAASYFLEKTDAGPVLAKAAAFSKDNGDDIWSGFGQYLIGLKEMADGDDKGAVESFRASLAVKSHFINTELEAKSWIKLLTKKK